MTKNEAIKGRWVAKDGSIFTEGLVEMRSDFPGNKTTYKVSISIAFNVGDEIAKHIVELHNRSLS